MIPRRSTLAAAAACTTLALACCSRPSDLPADLDLRVASAAARTNGAALYRQNCALCHGLQGDGQGARLSSFARAPRDFTNAAWRRATSADRVFRVIRDGVPGTAMPAWRYLGESQLADLTAYILSFAPER
jgi:cytochrome c oxidase cbb3-type subunit II